MAQFDLPLDQLHTYRPEVAEPHDFDEFWSRTLNEARAHDTPLTITPHESPLTQVEVYDLVFPGFAGQPVHAWFMLPANTSGALATVIEYNGYGGGRGLPQERLTWVSAGYAYLFMDTRGQGSAWGSGGVTPDPVGTGPSSPGFMTRGIESPETYYYRRVYTDAVRLIDAAKALNRVDAARIILAGGSQGGGIAIAAAGLADGVAAAVPDVPFLQHFGRAVGLTNDYPYQEIVQYLSVHRTLVAQTFATLNYVDGIHFAKRATMPALFSTALHDGVCPPSTVFASRNAWAGEADIEVYPFNQHEGGQALHWQRQCAWLQAHGLGA